jgi:hypothetical protein
MRHRRAARALAIAGALVIVADARGVTPLDTNALVNSDAESAAGAGDFNSVVAIPGWTTTGNFTTVQYSIGDNTDLNPSFSSLVGGGANYFAGGPNSASSTASQTLALSSDLNPGIDSSTVSLDLSALLGGYQDQNDSMKITVTYLGASNQSLGSFQVGPVLASDRNNDTSLLSRSASKQLLPAGTRSIRFVMDAERTDGSYNDGYADNLVAMIVPRAGDANADGKVNALDFNAIATNFGIKGATWRQGNFNQDVVVNTADFDIFAANFNGGAFAPPLDSIVPEPSCLALLSAIPLIFRRRRRY